MSWIVITEAHLLTKISGPELEAVRAAALADAQADPVQPTLDQVTREVRGYVAGCAANQLGDGNTIPDELLDAALSLAVVRFLSRAGGLSIDGEDNPRMKAAEAARQLLRDVAACRFAITQPEAVSDEVVSGGAITVVNSNSRRYTRDKMDSL
jgi:hypothetical protein